MEVKRLLMMAVAAGLLGCATPSPEAQALALGEVVIQDFESREPTACTTADVDLNEARVRQFFARAQTIDYRTLTERHPIAPCALLGNVRVAGQWCDWTIRPGGVGSLRCGEHEQHYFCAGCADLYAPQAPAR